MIGEQSRFPNNYTQMSVYVEHTDQFDMQGVLWHNATGLGWRYDSLVQMVQLYERFLNNIDYPQSTHRLRSMVQEDPCREMKELKDRAVDKDKRPVEDPTFIIKVKYRQNASWQGSIQWVEGGVEKNFRSTLELIKLMDEAMGSDGDIRWE